MKKIAIISLVFLTSCAVNTPFQYTTASAKIDAEILSRQYACNDIYSCSPHPVPYYLK